MSRRSPRTTALAARPFRGLPRISRAALAASVSLSSLLAFGAPAIAQTEGTLPGTQVLQGGRWTGARMPTVAQGNEGLVMTIKQEQQRALLDWSRFNIAKGEEVHFQQDGVDWIALNRIFDSRPSEIAGKITAKGQVWLQNTNGIIFKNGAQVNAHTIIATALPITERQLNEGLLSGNGVIRGTLYNPLYYDFSGINLPTVPRPTAGLNPDVLLDIAPRPIGDASPTLIDLLARAAIRQAVLRSRNYEGTSGDYDRGYGLENLSYYDAVQRRTIYMIDPAFSNNGLIPILEGIVAEIDVAALGDFDYQNFTFPNDFFSNPAKSAAIPQALRDAVAAKIKTQFVDNYDAVYSTAQSNYTNYIANSRVTVEQGATLTSTSSDTSSPGKIMLFGPNVTNGGKLVANDGQVLLAAGEQVKLSAQQGYTNSVRGGLNVNVMSVGPTDSVGSLPGVPCCAGTQELWLAEYLPRSIDIGMVATNTGEIVADRGAVSMTGRNVDQMGSILVTNGVRQRNGSIILQASHGFNISEFSNGGNYFGGALTLGKNSVTSITPDLSDLTGLAADTFAKGRVLLAGTDILLDENAKVISRSGEVTIHANPYGSGARGGTSAGASEGSPPEDRGDDGSFTMRGGALIDVSGLTDVERSVADNIFGVEVRSNEVSGSPKQRDGILIGRTVFVDRREGASIVDWTGALSGEQRTAAQMSTAGGTVQIRASKSAVVDDGAVIDVSGGSTKFLGGEIKTTRLKDSYGRFHDISDADPNLTYVGIYEATRTEAGYVEGADAGSIELLSGSAKLFGKLKGDVIVGERQKLASIGQIAAPRVPVGAVGGSLVTTPSMPEMGSATLHRGGPEFSAWSSTFAFITADENAFDGTLWRETGNNTGVWEGEDLRLDPSLIGQDWSEYEGAQPEYISFIEDDFFNGMGEMSLGYGSSHQTQTLNPGVTINLAPGGTFAVGAESGIQTVSDNVSIVVPSGTVQFGSGDGVTMGSDVLLSVAAPWVNDADAPEGTPVGFVDGGSISLLGVRLTGPITVDAGGGGWYRRTSPPTRTSPGTFDLIEGQGGSISLGQNGMALSEIVSLIDFNLGGLGGDGTLGLYASGDLIVGPEGGSSAIAEYVTDTFLNNIGAGNLLLGANSLSVIDGAHLLQQRRSMSFGGSPIDVATGSDLRDATELTLLPAHERPGGDLTLIAGALAIEQGAIVEADPTGSVSLQGETVRIDGTVRAHGGSISVGGQGATGGYVRIGSTAVIDASGIAQTVRTPGGIDGRTFWYDGRILDGGSISLGGDNLIVDTGALIDVSGTQGPLAVLRPGRYTAVKVNAIIGSDGGTIDIDAPGGYVLGTMKGDAGSAANYAGTLNINGGADGNLLVPGYGQNGVQPILDNLQYIFFPEPTPEAPLSLRQYFADNYSWMVGTLGFGPEDIEDIQITSVAEFTEFVRAALMPLIAESPEDAEGALELDPTLTALPDLPPAAGGGTFTVPEGYTPGDVDAFDRALTFLFQGPLGGGDPSLLGRGATLHIGAAPLASMPKFDTVSIGGSTIKSNHAVTVASGRVLNIGGIVSGNADMRFTGRNINLAGILPEGKVLDPATAGTLTISGETVEFASRFNVGGFAKVVIEATGDMRGGYSDAPLPGGSEFTPGLYATGDVVLRAAQIYPTTDGTLLFESPRSIRIESNGDSLAPLSAGGLLSFTAPLIEQAGTLRAPFGEIRLTATRTAIVDENGEPVLGEDGAALFTPGEVRLLPGSVTSTAADGRTILYGSTFDGQSWYAPLRNETDGELTTPPEKRVSLEGDVIDVQQGAVIDVSGSGDVLGLEFVAGPLGQSNVLEGDGVYAVVPAYGSSVIAPIDPLYNPKGNASDPNATDLGIGDAVWLAAFDGNAAGWYTLLPAEYALTPGGYRITLAGGVPAIPQSRQAGDDSFAVLGYRGVLGTSIADQVQSTYRLERGTDVRKRSEFFETYGNSFFSSERFLEGLRRSGNPFNADPRLPVDGGFLTLAASTSLTLDGTILAAGASGVSGARGGVVDIASDNIVIAAAGTDTSDLVGYLVLDPNKLSNIAESLLIGGIRRQGATGLEIVTGQLTRDSVEEVRTPEKSVGAENVVIRTDAANPLTGTELLFAANESVRVESGSVVRAVGDGADGADLAIAPGMPAYVNPFDPNGGARAYDTGGAFMRVSNLGEIQVSRTNVMANGGDMIVEAGATVEATDAILLDSTRDTLVGNGATVKAGAITAAAGLVSFGDAPAGTSGLVVSGGTLEGLGQATRLTLKSYSTFDFYGDVDLAFSGAAIFDGAALVDRGAAPGSVSISAGTLELRNSDAAAIDEIGSGGSLALAGDNIVFGEGDIDIAYAETSIDAGERLIFDGLGENNFDGALTVRAGEITGSSGAGHQIVAAGALALLANTLTEPLDAFPTAGALLDFSGTSIDIATTIRAGSGTVRATATEGDVRLASGALIDVSGADVSFFEVQGFLPGGGVQLTSVAGDVFVEDGSTVNISGGQAGGDAGALVLSAGRGIAVLDGDLQAAVAAGYRGGSFGLTTSTLADFGGLNALLNASGFSRSRDFAILDGDVTLNGVTLVDALRIVTGTGDITVAADAQIGSGSDKGGSILLASGGDLMIADGAAFDVSAKGENGRGGSVDLQVAQGGTIDVGAATIDVSGSGTGEGGQVRLRAAQTGNDVGVAGWGAQVTGGDTQLEAFRAYDLADADGDASNGHLAEIDTALQQQVIGDATAFMDANSDAIRARLGQAGNASFVIVPGIELRSEGDLDLVHNWNLSTARFDGRAGVLTLRAGGDLLINANLSDGFVNAVQTTDGIIPPNGWSTGSDPFAPPSQDFTNDQSWSYNLIGGADFAQTNVLSTLAGSDGDIMVGGLVRTGTGDIQLAASGNLDYEDPSFIEYRFGTNGGRAAGTLINVPAGTVITDGTVMKPTTFTLPTTVPDPENPEGPGIPFTATITVYPRLPAGTVLRKGTKVPAGTVMPDGSTLGADTVLTADVTLAAETIFPGELAIAGKTRTGSELVWEMPRGSVPSIPGVVTNMPVDPVTGEQLPFPSSGDNIQRVTFSIAGLGDVQVSNNVNGYNTHTVIMSDGRIYDDRSQFDLEGDALPIEQLNGAIYTVGNEAAPLAGFDPTELVGFANNNNNGLLINPTYLEKGGDIAINVAGSILGAGTVIENFRWLTFSGNTPTSSLYNNFGGKDPNAPFTAGGQTSMTILADNFRQGVGALGGGDINITTGGDVDNLTVALPTSLRVSGGTGMGDAKQVHYTGGGDLVMDVGRNLMGGLIQVSQGTGTIDVAGSVIATEQRASILINPRNGGNLTLVLDDADLNLQAGGDVTVRNITTSGVTVSRPLWLGYTQNTSIAITSLGGDITLFNPDQFDQAILPSKTALIATAGSVSFGTADQQMGKWIVDAWPDTRLDILAQQDVHFWGSGGDYQGGDLTIAWSNPEWVARAINPGGYLLPMFGSLPQQNFLTGQYEFNQAGPGYGIGGANVHSGSASYSRIYAAQGDLVGHGSQAFGVAPGAPHGGSFTFGHETRLKAGGDFRMGTINFITHDGSDQPSIEANGAIYLPDAVLYGPGRLWVQAGDEIYMGRTEGAGIRAREVASRIPTSIPLNGGSITMLAGIDQEPEYDRFFDYYLDPENLAEAPSWLREYFVPGDRGLTVSTDVVLSDGSTRTTVYAIELVNYIRELNGEAPIPTEAFDEVSGSRPITRGKLAAEIDPAEYAAALEAFQALDPALKRPLAVRILNAEVKTAGREAVGVSPDTDGRYVRNGDPTRGYDAIGRLFPGAQRRPGEALAEGEHSWTGDINMMVSQVRGESGGSVDLLTPGGSIQLASLSIANTSPGAAGIVTQRGGGINAITYGDYIVNQSRTMTADDGDILIWSSFGNIDAGRGRKTSLSVPPVAFPVDAFGQTRIQLSGLPNGAGIATLDQVDGKQGGDVDLYAFNGIVNAGDAGIRASRDLFIGAIEIRGLDNITVGGVSNVDLSSDEGSVGPLNLENFAQSAEDEALDKAFDMAAEVEKLRTVRQTILTGSVVSFGTENCVPSEANPCPTN